MCVWGGVGVNPRQSSDPLSLHRCSLAFLGPVLIVRHISELERLDQASMPTLKCVGSGGEGVSWTRGPDNDRWDPLKTH